MTEPDAAGSSEPPSGGSYLTATLALLVIAICVGLIIRRGGLVEDEREVLRSLPAPSEKPPAPLEDMRPLEEPKGGFVGSAACRECHTDQHESWHASYHRTMTQPASPETIDGNFNNITLGLHGTNGLRHFHLKRNDQYFWVEALTDKEMVTGPEGLPAMFPVVMTTGSHHMQTYWMSVGRDRTVGMLPAVYLREQDRWIPRRSSFLKPPHHDISLETGRWDAGCVRCHTTGGRPKRIKEGGGFYFDSAVSEFGISCEACHGMGEEHVRLRREARDTGVEPTADPIVNPDQLNADLSAQVCGSCHSALIFKTDEHVHLPGRPLDTNYVELMGLDQRTRDYMKTLYRNKHAPDLDSQIEMDLYGMFWGDGQMRVIGREYSSMRESECHTHGDMSCTSCHQLHKSRADSRSFEEWADDQLGKDMRGDQACTQCHAATEFAVERHTHHATASDGSRCMNCHMPHTTYGLLKASRSHTINSPSAQETLDAKRPNACNLCHLDKTLAWTAGHLNEWYGIEPPKLEAPWLDTSAAVVGALRGDATVRALLAWHFGWEPARKVSTSERWTPPILSVLMDDDYDAIRYVAGRSLKQTSGYDDLPYDFVAPPQHRQGYLQPVLDRWKQSAQPGLTNRPEILIKADGSFDTQAVDAHLTKRDNRPVAIHE